MLIHWKNGFTDAWLTDWLIDCLSDWLIAEQEDKTAVVAAVDDELTDEFCTSPDPTPTKQSKG